MHKMYINKIVESGSAEDLKKLESLLGKAIDHIKECDYELYKCMETELYTAIYGKKFTENMARDIINNMKPYGCHFSLEESKSIQNQYGLTNLEPMEFWIVINSAYNDYRDILEDNIEMYAKFAKNFIMDEDAVKDKVWEYFCVIPKK